MSLSPGQLVFILSLAFGAFGGLVFLRVMAMNLRNAIEPYELAREARRLRAEHERHIAELTGAKVDKKAPNVVIV